MVGGTSCSAPAFAGIMALVVQHTGERQGNACPELYRLGNAQYGASGPKVFHDVVAGTNTVPGTTGWACGPGYDLATGLGSLDATALVEAWGK
jgi:subtilase family serine protease